MNYWIRELDTDLLDYNIETNELKYNGTATLVCSQNTVNRLKIQCGTCDIKTPKKRLSNGLLGYYQGIQILCNDELPFGEIKILVEPKEY